MSQRRSSFMSRTVLALCTVLVGCLGEVSEFDGGAFDGEATDGATLRDGGNEPPDSGAASDGGETQDAGKPAASMPDASIADASVDACVPVEVFRDADGDGFGGTTMQACVVASGWVTRGGDCDDTDPRRFPGATLREGTDSNCDTFIDFDVDGDRQSDLSPPGLTFDPATQRHVELPEVPAGAPFSAELHDGRFSPEGTVIVTPAFANRLTWSTMRRAFEGSVRDPGVYRFVISVCTTVPFDATACALPQHRRLDLAHLTVRGPVSSSPEPAARGPFATASSRVDLDVTGVLRPIDVGLLTTIAASEPDPARRPDFLGLGTVSPTRLIAPMAGGAVAPGVFPLVVILHGNGYHWDDYDELGALLASHGLVVVVPQFANGFLGGCGGGPSTQQRVQFGMRAVSWALAQSATPGAPLAGHLDASKVLVIGHSWGGAAAEWSMPVVGARAFVIFDPISLLNNVLEWRSCTTNLFVPDSGTDHLAADYRDVSTPVLLLDSGRSGFTSTLAEYRGLYRSPPLVHVSVQNAMHEDFLDASEAMRWLPPGTCYDQSRLDVFHEEAARWVMRFVRRYVLDDASEDSRVHGFDAFTAPGLLSTRVATWRPASDTRVLDSAARFPMGPFSSATNLVGGLTTFDAADASVGLTQVARALAPMQSDGGRSMFSQATIDFLESSAGYRHFTGTQLSRAVNLDSSLAPPLVVDSFRAACVDGIVEGPLMARCLPDAGEDPLDPVSLTVTFAFEDGGVAQRTISATASYFDPQTFCAPMAGLPSAPLTAVRFEVAPGSRSRSVALTDVRLVH